MTNLDPCPFCGSDDVKVAQHRQKYEDEPSYDSWSVACCECGASMTALTQVTVKQKWNRRETDPRGLTEMKAWLEEKFEEEERRRESADTRVAHQTLSERMHAYSMAISEVNDLLRTLKHQPDR